MNTIGNENNQRNDGLSLDNDPETQTGPYRVYPIRWFQMFIYVLATFGNGLLVVTFSSIESETVSIFTITTSQVNALLVICFFLYVPGTVLATWAFKKFSMKKVMIIGSIMNLGTWIRVFSLINPRQGYAALILGQIPPALSTPIFFNAVAEFSDTWFASGQRDLITAICSMANPLGTAVGYLLPSLIISDPPSQQQFLALLLAESIFVTLNAIVLIIFFKSKPPTPPSSSEKAPEGEFIKDFLSLIKNYHFLILLFSFSIGFALFNALGSLLYQLMKPSGYSSVDAGICGALIIVIGLISSGLAGVIMCRTHAYRIILKVLIVGACVSMIFFIVILRPSMIYPLAVSCALMGFFLLPLLPVVFECAVECTYPINDIFSVGLLLCMGSVFSGVFIFVLEALIDVAPIYKGEVFTPASTFIFFMVIVAAIPLLFYSGPYLKLNSGLNHVTDLRV